MHKIVMQTWWLGVVGLGVLAVGLFTLAAQPAKGMTEVRGAAQVGAMNRPASSPTPPCGVLGEWTVQQPITEATGGVTVSGDGTYAYAVNGYDYTAGHIVAQFAKYDVATDTWSSLPNTPAPFYGATAVYAPSDGKLYVFGGFDTTSTPLTDTRIFDFGSNSWSLGAAMPLAQGGMGADYAGGKIYLVGGQGSGVAFYDHTWAYDVAADTWMTMTAMPAARIAPAAGVIGGHLYAAGGLNTSFAEVATLFDYDIATNTWSSGANMPTATFGGAGAVAGGKLYVMGGGFPDAARNITQIYDAASNSWSAGPLLQEARTFGGAATAGGYLVVVGGDTSSSTATNSTEASQIGDCASVTPTANIQPTDTPPPSATSALPTATATVAATATLTPTGTLPLPTDTPLPSATATNCPVPFVDINGNVFYNAITYLYCRGVVSGTDGTHYTPAGTATRGQFAKVVVLGFGIASYTPVGNPDFTDVPSSYFAYEYIEAGFHAGILSGFDAGTCAAIGATFPCYGPNRPITRAQLTKLVVNAGQYPPYTPTSGQTFSDVGPSNVFYGSIETAAHYGIINGYGDNTFRPNNNIRRDEMAQVVYKGIINRP